MAIAPGRRVVATGRRTNRVVVETGRTSREVVATGRTSREAVATGRRTSHGRSSTGLRTKAACRSASIRAASTR